MKKRILFSKLVIHEEFSCSNVIVVRANPPSLRLTSILLGQTIEPRFYSLEFRATSFLTLVLVWVIFLKIEFKIQIRVVVHSGVTTDYGTSIIVDVMMEDQAFSYECVPKK